MNPIYARHKAQLQSQLAAIKILCFAAGIMFACAGFGVYVYCNTVEERADRTRLVELEAEHSDCKAALAKAEYGSAEYAKYDRRARIIRAEHARIMANHPTWNVRPLEPFMYQLPKREGR